MSVKTAQPRITRNADYWCIQCGQVKVKRKGSKCEMCKGKGGKIGALIGLLTITALIALTLTVTAQQIEPVLDPEGVLAQGMQAWVRFPEDEAIFPAVSIDITNPPLELAGATFIIGDKTCPILAVGQNRMLVVIPTGLKSRSLRDFYSFKLTTPGQVLEGRVAIRGAAPIFVGPANGGPVGLVAQNLGESQTFSQGHVPFDKGQTGIATFALTLQGAAEQSGRRAQGELRICGSESCLQLDSVKIYPSMILAGYQYVVFWLSSREILQLGGDEFEISLRMEGFLSKSVHIKLEDQKGVPK